MKSSEKLSVQDLIGKVASTSGMSKKTVEDFVRAFTASIDEGLHTDGSVRLKGFGTFKLIWNLPRKSVNVRTGEEYVIPGHNKLSFVPEEQLKNQFGSVGTETKEEKKTGTSRKRKSSSVAVESELSPQERLHNEAERIKPQLSGLGVLDTETSNAEENEQDRIQMQRFREQAEEIRSLLTDFSLMESEETEQEDEKKEAASVSNMEPVAVKMEPVSSVMEPVAAVENVEKDGAVEAQEQEQAETKTETVEAGKVAEAPEVPAEASTNVETPLDLNNEVLSGPPEQPSVEPVKDEIVAQPAEQPVETPEPISQEEPIQPVESVTVVSQPAVQPTPVTLKSDDDQPQPIENYDLGERELPIKRSRSKWIDWLIILLLLIFLAGILFFIEYRTHFFSSAVEKIKTEWATRTARMAQSEELERNEAEIKAKQSDTVIMTIGAESAMTSAEKPVNENVKSGIDYESYGIKERAVIRTGETLSSIAKRDYGHAYFWVYIYEANIEKLGENKHPDVGHVVVVRDLPEEIVDAKSKDCLQKAKELAAKYE